MRKHIRLHHGIVYQYACFSIFNDTLSKMNHFRFWHSIYISRPSSNRARFDIPKSFHFSKKQTGSIR